MKPQLIPTNEFANYEDGIPAIVNAIVFADEIDDYVVGGVIEVYQGAIGSNAKHFSGTILQNFGIVESIPDKPVVIRLEVKRL